MGSFYFILYMNSAFLVDFLFYGLAYLLFPTIFNSNCFEGDMPIVIMFSFILHFLGLWFSLMCESDLGEVLVATFFMLVIEYGMIYFLIVGFWPKVLLPIIVTVCWFFIAMPVRSLWIEWENN